MRQSRCNLFLIALALCSIIAQTRNLHLQAPVAKSWGEQRHFFHSHKSTVGRGRLLQTDNPSNPTGPNMTVNIDYWDDPGPLTPEMINNISSAAGQNISGNTQLYYPNTTTTNTSSSNATSQTASNQTANASNQPNVNLPLPTNQTAEVKNQTSSSGSSSTANMTNTTIINPTQNVTRPAANGTFIPSTPNVSSPNTSSTSPPPLINVINNETIVGNESASYVYYPVEELVTSPEFIRANALAKASIPGYVNDSQLLRVWVQDQGNNFTNFREVVRLPWGVTQIDVLLYPDGSVFISPRRNLKVNKAVADQNSTKFTKADSILRANYPRLIFDATVVSASEEYIPALNSSVLVIRYRNKTTQGEYEFTTEVTDGDQPSVKVLNVNASRGVSLPENVYYGSVPLWTYLQNTDYNLRAVDALVRRFIYQNYGSAQQKTFSVVGVFNSLSNTSDLNRYFLNYLVDNKSFEIGATLNLTSRRIFLEYFRQRNGSNFSVASFPTREGFNELNFLRFSVDPAFRQLDTAARQQYPRQLGQAVVTQVEQGKVGNTTRYRVVYMADGKYYQVNSP